MAARLWIYIVIPPFTSTDIWLLVGMSCLYFLSARLKRKVDKTSYKPQCRSDGRIMDGRLDVQGGPHSYFLNYLGY